jgi:hypothetical protein
VEYLSCERCGLEIKVQAAYLRLNNCPRCLGRSTIVSPLVSRAPTTDATTTPARNSQS